MGKSRLEAFTDGVVAIIITILVLDLHLSDTNHTLAELAAKVPTFIAYTTSFIGIAAIWINHHHIFTQVKTVTEPILWTNINFLFWLSLSPAATAWFGSDIMSPLAAFVYQFDIILFNLAFLWLRRTVLHENHEIDSPRISREVASIAVNVAALITLWVFPPIVFIALLANVSIWVIPWRHILQR